MTVTVRYMAQVRHAAGVVSEEVRCDQPCSVQDFLVRLAGQHGEALRRLLLDADGRISPTLLVFVNDEQVGPGEGVELADGSVVTVLSPIAGG